MSVIVKYDAALFASFEDLRMHDGRPQCIAHVKDLNRRRCLSTSNSSAVDLQQLETSILRAESLDCTRIKQYIRDYVTSRLCPKHHRILKSSALITEVARRWRKDLQDCRRAADHRTNLPRTFELCNDACAECAPLEATAAKRYMLRKRTTQGRQPIRQVVSIAQVGNLKFDPRSKPTPRTTSKLLRTDLEAKVAESGCLYILTRASDPGFLKIGRGKNVEGRLATWEKCHGELTVSYCVANVPHVWRAESLIHTDPRLKQHRKDEISCLSTSCGKRHIEWFEVELEDAKTVVNEWVSFLKQESPYAGGRLRDVWAAVVRSNDNLRPDELQAAFRRHYASAADRVERLHNPLETHGISYPILPSLEAITPDHIAIDNDMNLQGREASGSMMKLTSNCAAPSMNRRHASAQTIKDVTATQMSQDCHESSAISTRSPQLLPYVYAWMTKDMQRTGRVLLIFFSIEATAQGVGFMHRLILAISLIFLSSWSSCVKA